MFWVFLCFWACNAPASEQTNANDSTTTTSSETTDHDAVFKHINETWTKYQNRRPDRGLTYQLRDYYFRTEAYRNENNALVMMVNNGEENPQGKTDIFMFFKHGVPHILLTEKKGYDGNGTFFLQEYGLFKENQLESTVYQRRAKNRATLDTAQWQSQIRSNVDGEMLEQNMRHSLNATGSFQLFFDKIENRGDKEWIVFTTNVENTRTAYTTTIQIGEVADEVLNQMRQSPEKFQTKPIEIDWEYRQNEHGGWVQENGRLIPFYKSGKWL